MQKLLLPDALREHIAELRQEIALTDPDGRVVAYLFAPDQREAFFRNEVPPDAAAVQLGTRD